MGKGKQKVKKKNIQPNKTKDKVPFFWIFGVLVVTLIAYLPAFKNGLTNFDDIVYVSENPYIRQITWQNITTLFSEFYYGGYYPLTLLSFMIDIQIGGMNPFIFHFTNIMLHLANTLLVFIFIRQLFKKIEIPIIAALLFGLHTLHVESVAWVSERKDVLYTFFFLISLITYNLYLSKGKQKYYIWALYLFLMSVLSKTMAVALAPTLLLLDWFQGRKLTDRKVILEKAPFFVIGILFGILTILSQKSIGAIAEESTLPILHRFVFACYGFSIYLLKTIFPFGLSAFYPYPIDSGDTIPIAYWLSLIPVIAILGLIIYFLKKKRDYAFALLFYVLNIVLVLQIIQINDFVMADRFMYVASLGLILIMALLYRDVLKKYPDRSSILRIGVAAYGVVLLFMTSNRTEVWKDSISIWNDIINQYPDEIPKAYYFRGHSRIDNQDYQAAMNDFNKVIELEPKYYLPLAYHSRATTNANLGNIQKALADLESAIRLDPEDSKFYLLRAQIRLNQKDTISAKRDYDKIIELNPEDYSAYYYRAIFFTQTKKYPSALEDYNQVVLLNPDMGEIYYNRAIIKLQLKQREGACEDFRIAEGLGYERAKSMIRNNCLRF